MAKTEPWPVRLTVDGFNKKVYQHVAHDPLYMRSAARRATGTNG